MYVCLCYTVTDAQIREAIDGGARDVADLGRRTGGGTDCGQCRHLLERLIADLVVPQGTDRDRGRE